MLNLNKPPAVSVNDLDPDQLEVLRRSQSDFYDIYVQWLNHPFTKLRWQEAYQRMREIGSQILALRPANNPDLDAEYRMMKGIVDGTLDSDVYHGAIGKLTTAAFAEVQAARRADAAMGGEGGGGHPPHPVGPARVFANMQRGEPTA